MTEASNQAVIPIQQTLKQMVFSMNYVRSCDISYHETFSAPCVGPRDGQF